MLLTLAFLLAGGLSSSAPVHSGSPRADDISAKLNKEVSNYNLGLCTWPGALLRISSDFKIPMGIVWVNSSASRAQIPFAWTHATIREIIQAVAKTQPNYHVQVANGVVHVFPSIPDRENFLKIKIHSFKADNTMLEVASFKLHMLVTPIEGSHQFSVAGPGDSLVSVDMKNCTVEDVLDALTVASSRKVWIVTFPDNATVMANGIRRTESLFTDLPIPDDQQPLWHLQRWGDPAPPLWSPVPSIPPGR